MSIVRGPSPKSEFYVLRNSISQNRKLSWQARGLLIYLLSKPLDWKVSVEALRKETEESQKPTGRDGIYAMIAEIESAGYMRKKPGRDKSGRLSGYEYEVVDEPFTAEPDTAEPDTANPTLQRTEPKKEQKPQNVEQARPVPLDKILSIYNKICGDVFKRAARMNSKREKQIRACWTYKVDGKLVFQSAQFWSVYFERCLLNKHWRGETSAEFKASLEFLTRKDVMERVVDEILVEMESAA
ncbi:hypothetical protein D3C81_1497090 [compost metagenome]